MNRLKKIELFDVCNVLLLTFIVAVIIYPVWYVLICSFSNSDAVVTGRVILLPKQLTLDSYRLVFETKNLFTAYGNTIYYTFAGTVVNLVFTLLAAYPLSKARLAGRRWITLFILLSMWFSAGIIPTYLNFKELGLLNNRASIIFGFALTTFYIILLRSQFESVPASLEESAKIDGANDFRIFWDIYIPLSVPTLMTLGLYYAVDRWNGYFWAMLLFTDDKKIPLQVLLTKLISGLSAKQEMNAVDTYAFSKETVVYGTIMVSMIPMLILYPFIQRFFVKGITLGAVKE